MAPSDNQTFGIAESDGVTLSELLSIPFKKSNTIEDDQRFLESARDGSGTTKTMIMLWLLSQLVGAIWNPYCRFVLLTGLIASPVIAGVQLAHRWKRSGKTTKRAFVGGICLFGGAAIFVSTMLYGGEGKWDSYRSGAMLSKLGTYGGLYVMVFGLSVTMGDARRGAC